MRPFLIFAPLALAACLPVIAQGEPTCVAADYQGLIRTELALLDLPAGLIHRIIPVDSAVTLDFAPDRLNIWLDRDNRVQSVSCG